MQPPAKFSTWSKLGILFWLPTGSISCRWSWLDLNKPQFSSNLSQVFDRPILLLQSTWAESFLLGKQWRHRTMEDDKKSVKIQPNVLLTLIKCEQQQRNWADQLQKEEMQRKLFAVCRTLIVVVTLAVVIIAALLLEILKISSPCFSRSCPAKRTGESHQISDVELPPDLELEEEKCISVFVVSHGVDILERINRLSIAITDAAVHIHLYKQKWALFMPHNKNENNNKRAKCICWLTESVLAS